MFKNRSFLLKLIKKKEQAILKEKACNKAEANAQILLNITN
jgi:hypothetical protein